MGRGVERGLLPLASMTPSKPKPQVTPPPQSPPDPPDQAEFADEAGPKKTEFESEKDAKDLTAGGFDPIP